MLLADPGVEIWYGEEVHFHLHTTITRMWAPKGRQPEIPSKPGRAKVGLFDAINPATGELFFKEVQNFNTQTFTGFLLEFHALRKERASKKIVLIVDNAAYHKKAVRELGTREGQIVFLPPYSPDLNPMERVWRWTRRCCTHNKYFDYPLELLATVGSFLAEYKEPNEILQSLCAINNFCVADYIAPSPRALSGSSRPPW